MKRLAVILLLATDAFAAPPRSATVPRGCRDRSCVRERAVLSGISAPVFTLAEHLVFVNSGVGTIPNVQGDPSGVFTAMPNRDGGNTWEVYDDGGVPMTTVQGVGTVFGGNFAGGRAMLDVTDATHPFTTDARLRAMYLGDWTIMCSGFCTTRGSATTQIWLDQYDGTHEVSLYGQGSAFRVSNDGTSHFAETDTTYGGPRDGEALVWGRQSGNTLCAGTMDVASETNCITHSPPAAMTAGHTDWGAFPAPFTGNACRGNLNWCVGWQTAKSDSAIQGYVWNWWGANRPSAMLSPTLQHNVPQLEGWDNTTTSGFVDVFKSYAVMIDPVLGAGTTKAFTNYANATPIDVSAFSTVGSPTVAANLIPGPFGRRLNTSPCGRIVKSGAVAGVTSDAVPSLDGGSALSGWYNASAFLARGDAGTTINKARIQFTWGGVIDGGNIDKDGGCDISGLTDVALRYPRTDAGVIGCYAWVDNPSLVTASVLVNDGSLFMCQEQLTATLMPMRPTIDNGAKGVGFNALDGGALPSGATQGGIGVVVQLPIDSAQYVNLGNVKSVSSFLEDAFSSAAPNHIITHVYGDQVNTPAMLAILYGASFGMENYLITSLAIPAFMWFRVDLQWVTLGGQCKATSYYQVCADQAHPENCTIGPAINTGTYGECPLQADTVYLGNRYDSSDNGNIQTAVFDVWR